MPPISLLLRPPSGLAGCLFAGIYRDTSEAELGDRDRFNHFPASPLVTVTKVLEGDLRIIAGNVGLAAMKTRPKMTGTLIHGPQKEPITSWSPGGIKAISIGFYYDAWLLLGGDPRFETIPAALENALADFDVEEDVARNWDRFCDHLVKEWKSKKPSGWSNVFGISDWVRETAARAVLSNTGRSLRSLERYLKRWSGHTRRTLEFYKSFEDLHQLAARNPRTSLADLAAMAGYADQSHMGRAVRRATGFSPAKLNRAIQDEEAFWCYRLLGERF